MGVDGTGRLPDGLEGRFERVRLLGRGGFGEVHEVFARDGGERLALKLIPLEGDGARQARELAASTRVGHRHLLRCRETGKAGELAYLLLELADENLREVLRAPARRDEAWRLVCQAVRGVAALHAAGLVHRDLKPENVLVVDGQARVADLGMAKGGDLATVTRTGVLMGTPDYMSPEQARGEKPGPASDVFSLGAMLYEVLEGRPPHPGGDLVEVVTRLSRGEVLDLVATPDAHPAAPLVRAALAAEPGARPRDLSRWADELEAAGRALPDPAEKNRRTRVLGRPVSASASTGRSARRRSLQRAARRATPMILVLLLGSVLVGFLSAPEITPKSAAPTPVEPFREYLAEANRLGRELLDRHDRIGGVADGRGESLEHADRMMEELLDPRQALRIRRIFDAHRRWIEAVPPGRDPRLLGEPELRRQALEGLVRPLNHLKGDLHLLLEQFPRRQLEASGQDLELVARYAEVGPRYREAVGDLDSEKRQFFAEMPAPGEADPLVEFVLFRLAIEILPERSGEYFPIVRGYLDFAEEPGLLEELLVSLTKYLSKVPVRAPLDCDFRGELMADLLARVERIGVIRSRPTLAYREIFAQDLRDLVDCTGEQDRVRGERMRVAASRFEVLVEGRRNIYLDSLVVPAEPQLTEFVEGRGRNALRPALQVLRQQLAKLNSAR